MEAAPLQGHPIHFNTPASAHRSAARLVRVLRAMSRVSLERKAALEAEAQALRGAIQATGRNPGVSLGDAEKVLREIEGPSNG